jgi:hypothetical protein
VLHSLVISLVMSLLVLAVSALSRSARVAGLAFFGLVLGLEVVRGILQFPFQREEAMLLSLQADLKSLGKALFGVVDHTLSLAWPWPALVLVLVGLGCLLVLRKRVRAVEIVT